MIRRMYKFSKHDSENMESFMRRSNRILSDSIEKHGLTSWDVQARREVFKWGGWVARLSTFDSNRITLHILLHKNWDWICNIASQFNGNQLHGRHLRVWRWESLLYRYFDENYPGVPWVAAAQDILEWNGVVQSVN